MEFNPEKSFDANFESSENFNAVFGGTGETDTKEYEGDYTVTPSRETQVLKTRNLRMKGNVTINPIPPNYGLITWNGSALTVS